METLVEAHLAEQLLTYAEYRELEVDDNLWYELLNGELVKKSSPSPRHQIAQANLFWLMENHCRINKLGKILCATLDVYIDEYNVPQPDLLFISSGKYAHYHERRHHGRTRPCGRDSFAEFYSQRQRH